MAASSRLNTSCQNIKHVCQLENHPFIDYCRPLKPSMFRGFSIATFDYQMARWYSKIGRLVLHRRIACLRPWQHRRSFISNLVASGPTWHISIYCIYIIIYIYILANQSDYTWSWCYYMLLVYYKTINNTLIINHTKPYKTIFHSN